MHINPRALQEHSTSLNSVPTRLRHSLIRMGTIRRIWFDGVSFFCSMVKMVRAFVTKTTARSRCVRVFLKLRSVAYVPISCLPHIVAIMCHHERGSKDIFRPHTEAFACRRSAFFIPWTAGVNIFRVNVKADFVTITLTCGSPWGRHGCS